MGSPVTGLLARWLPVALFGAVILGASSIPGRALPPGPMVGFDKLVHGCVYSVLGFLIVRALWPRVGGRGIARAVVFASLFAGLFGVLDEVYQGTTPGRSPDVADAVADFVGALVGASLGSVILRRYRQRTRRNHGDPTEL